MLTEKEIQELQQLILLRIAKTEKDIIELEEIVKPVSPDNAIGRLSRMDAINNKSVTEAALRQSKEKLNKLKFAQTIVNKQGYGVCVKCGMDIPFGRLKLMPESNKCTNCA